MRKDFRAPPAATTHVLCGLLSMQLNIEFQVECECECNCECDVTATYHLDTKTPRPLRWCGSAAAAAPSTTAKRPANANWLPSVWSCCRFDAN